MLTRGRGSARCDAAYSLGRRMIGVTLLSHGFNAEYEIGFANGLALNGVDVVLLGSDNTLTERARPGVRVLNVRGQQSPKRSVIAKLLNMLRYFGAYLGFLAKRRGHPVHVIGLFSTRS